MNFSSWHNYSDPTYSLHLQENSVKGSHAFRNRQLNRYILKVASLGDNLVILYALLSPAEDFSKGSHAWFLHLRKNGKNIYEQQTHNNNRQRDNGHLRRNSRFYWRLVRSQKKQLLQFVVLIYQHTWMHLEDLMGDPLGASKRLSLMWVWPWISHVGLLIQVGSVPWCR